MAVFAMFAIWVLVPLTSLSIHQIAKERKARRRRPVYLYSTKDRYASHVERW